MIRIYHYNINYEIKINFRIIIFQIIIYFRYFSVLSIAYSCEYFDSRKNLLNYIYTVIFSFRLIRSKLPMDRSNNFK